MFRRVRKLTGMASEDRWLLTESLLFLCSARIILFILPFRSVMKISLLQNDRNQEYDETRIIALKRSLYQADRHSLWKNRCLVMSIAGRWMLQRRGIASAISFGVRHDGTGRLIAHAWLKVYDIEVVEKGGDYNELVIL